MNYQETLDYLYTQLPMFHRIGSDAYKPNLDNTWSLARLLDNPQDKFKAIHVAGTNGKGSTSHMLASILQCAGYKTGLFTSPHLKDFRERIRINGTMIPELEVYNFVKRHKEQFDEIQPSFFEWTVGLCFDYFAKEQIDIAVVETGLGGRLDSTNIINPLLSVITNIGYDHTAILGNTLPKIAAEKAGIIKQHTPVVIGETHAETKEVFEQKAQEMQVSICFADQLLSAHLVDCHSERREESQMLHFNIINALGTTVFENLALDLIAIYQQKNILTVLQSITELRKQGLIISDEAIRDGLQHVQQNTGLMGRWQTIARNPLSIADTGHNEDGIKQVLQQLKRTPYGHLHWVFGAVNDKDLSGVLALLPKTASYYFCKADIPRALDVEILVKEASTFSLRGNVYPSVMAAYQAARHEAKADDLVLVGGSTFVVAEVL